MARFTIYATVTATVKERWIIEAESEAEARTLFEDAPDGQQAEFMDQEVIGDEENREVISIERAYP